MAVAGLFAGIGGFEMGFRSAGFETSLLCEIDPAARAVLSARFGFDESDILDDVRAIDALPAGTQIVCAGFPCQDLSSSGPKEGIEGAKSSLIGEVFRILEAGPVEWVVIENVPFMLKLGRGQAIRKITSRLSALGYRWAYRVVDSLGFGVPQRRRRVYIVASLNHDPRAVLLVPETPQLEDPVPDLDAPVGFYWTEGTRSTGLAADSVPPLKGGSTIGIPSAPGILFPNGIVGTPDIRDAERLQGFPADWTRPASEVTRNSFRWKLVGNAVTVNVTRWLAGRLNTEEVYDPAADAPLKTSGGWPDSAWSENGQVFRANVSHYPVRHPNQGLAEFLEFPVKPLSVKATTGFLRRADAGGLWFPEGFLDALAAHVDEAQGLGAAR